MVALPTRIRSGGIVASALRARRRRRDALCHEPTLRFQIGAIPVSLATGGAELLEDFAALYDGCGCDALPDEHTIHMRIAHVGPALLGRARHRIFGDGEQLFSGRLRCELLPYLEWGINWRVIARRNEFLQLHAAVLSYNGQAALFVGDSGVGKSTLACGLISRGWQYLSDEFALIHPDSLRVHPFPKALCVKQGSFATVTRLGIPLWRRDHYVKAFKGPVAYVRTADMGGQVATDPVPIRYIVFPRYVAGQAPRLRSIARGAAAFALTANTFNRNVLAQRTVSIVSRVVRRVHCIGLDSGDLEPTCDLIESELLPEGGRGRGSRRAPPSSGRDA